MWGIGYNGVKFFLGLVYSNFSYLRHIFITEIEEVSCENMGAWKLGCSFRYEFTPL